MNGELALDLFLSKDLWGFWLHVIPSRLYYPWSVDYRHWKQVTHLERPHLRLVFVLLHVQLSCLEHNSAESKVLFGDLNDSLSLYGFDKVAFNQFRSERESSRVQLH